MTTEAKLGLAIGKRRSIRRYLPDPIEPRMHRADFGGSDAGAISAQQAAVAVRGTRRPCRARKSWPAAMGQRLRRDRTADGDDPQAIEDDVARSYARITEAPVVIVVCVDSSDMDRYPDERRAAPPSISWRCKARRWRLQNMLLAADSEGLGACVMCAPLFCPDSSRGGLDLAERMAGRKCS